MNYIELFTRYMSGLTSLEEDRMLLDWMKTSESKDTIYAYFQQNWEKTENQSISADLQQEMLDSIKQQIRMKGAESKKRNVVLSGSRKIYQTVFNYAAAVLLLLLMSLSFYLYQSTHTDASEVVVCAEKGQRSNLVLPDGTKVWLNSDSRLTYSTDYGHQERGVELEGEAFFEVAKDKDHRFIVNAGNIMIEALGTKFNVNAYPDSKKVNTSLVEGKVRVSTANGEQTMVPNEEIIFNRSTGRMTKNKMENIEYATSWMKNGFSFQGSTLKEITEELSRMYNLTIIFRTEEIMRYHFTGIIKNNSLTNILDIIKLTAPIEYEVRNDSIFLNKK